MQHVSVITLGVGDLARSARFYREGLGWTSVFENEQIIFYQLEGLVLGTFLKEALEADMQRPGSTQPCAFSLAQNVRSREEVKPLVDKLVAAGGRLLRAPDEPPHGGLRGYVADPDDHAWEIAWIPGFTIDDKGRATFGL